MTNGDNAYGSEVVENILRVGGSSNDEVDTTPAMLLNPIDSRNFAEQGLSSHYVCILGFMLVL